MSTMHNCICALGTQHVGWCSVDCRLTKAFTMLEQPSVIHTYMLSPRFTIQDAPGTSWLPPPTWSLSADGASEQAWANLPYGKATIPLGHGWCFCCFKMDLIFGGPNKDWSTWKHAGVCNQWLAWVVLKRSFFPVPPIPCPRLLPKEQE